MLTKVLVRFSTALLSAVQACVPAALNDTEVEQAIRSIRTIESALAAVKVKLASARASRHGHHDGGANTLKELGGMSARQARQSISTANTLRRMSTVQSATEDGTISPDNASRLARAARKTSPQAVDSDSSLIAAAQRCAADDFDKAASRWEQSRQTDGGLAQHLINRRKRSLRFWTQDNMIHFKGRTDLLTGTALKRHIERLARQLRKQDSKTGPKPGNGLGPDPGPLTYNQAMFDALNTTHSSTTPHDPQSSGTTTVSAHQPHTHSSTTPHDPQSATEESVVDSNHLKSHSDHHMRCHTDASDHTQSPDIQTSCHLTNNNPTGTAPIGTAPIKDATPHTITQEPSDDNIHKNGPMPQGVHDSGSGMPKAEVIVVMDLPALLGDNTAHSEIPGIGPIPPALARQLASVNKIVPILMDGNGKPLRHNGTKRLATREQWHALIARDRTCIGCGAPPQDCQAHHHPPYSQTGRTWIEELTLLCYQCHHKTHDHNWQVTKGNNGYTLQPPNSKPPSNATSNRPPTRRDTSNRHPTGLTSPLETHDPLEPVTSAAPERTSETSHNRIATPSPDTYQPPLLC